MPLNDDSSIRCLFTDVGGVLATNGWDSDTRRAAADHFQLDPREMDSRHRMTFDTYEIGKLSLDTYLDRVVFYQPRSFTRQQFRDFLLTYSQPFPEMIALVRSLKVKYQLKVAVISNEGRELTEYRIRKFGLAGFVDFFVSSCFVHYRKPDTDIFQMALDLAQIPAPRCVYLEDRAMFAEVAQTVGINAIQHLTYEQTKAALATYGLTE